MRFNIEKFLYTNIMSIEFAIIPITSTFLSAANDIKLKLEHSIKLEINIVIDTNYDTSFNNRINKWKKQDYDIITIDESYDKSNSIVVRFSDKGSRAQVMQVEEFIELVVSFEDDNVNTNQSDTNQTDTNQTDTNKSDTEQDGGCIIM